MEVDGPDGPEGPLMTHGSGFEEKETWAFETYAQGMLDAAADMPDRKFRFITGSI